jgi:ribonucleoside-diphosphate reductase alpha chain
MYLETRNIDEYEKIYTEAWKRGLKTTYYLHVKPRHQSEQTTVKANKSEEIRKSDAKKVGFGFAKRAGR